MVSQYFFSVYLQDYKAIRFVSKEQRHKLDQVENFFCIIYCDSMLTVVTSHSRHYVTKIKSDLSNNKHIIYVINSIFLVKQHTINYELVKFSTSAGQERLSLSL